MRPHLMLGLVMGFVVGAVAGSGGMWLWLTRPKVYVGAANVIDGDTLRIERRRIRLVGINAPELPSEPKKCRRYLSRPECIEPAATALYERIEGKQVTCTEVGRDRFGRTLGICYHDGEELNVWLLKRCLAHSPPNPKHRDPRYEAVIAARTCPTATTPPVHAN